MGEWHTILIDGNERATRGFVSGFVGDRDIDPTQVLLAEDVGVQPESLGERVLQLVTGGGHHLVLVAEEHVATLVHALEHAGAAAGLRIAERHQIVRVRFAFAVEAFSREVAERVRAALRPLPVGVTFETHDEQEEERSDAKGVELYAPEHAYTYRAHGRLAGALDGVLAVRRVLGDIEAVRLEGLQLELR